MTGAPAGWCPDPQDPARQRFWDGARWTEQVMPAPSTSIMPPPAPPADKRTRRIPAWLWWVLAVAGVVVAIVLSPFFALISLVFLITGIVALVKNTPTWLRFSSRRTAWVVTAAAAVVFMVTGSIATTVFPQDVEPVAAERVAPSPSATPETTPTPTVSLEPVNEEITDEKFEGETSTSAADAAASAAGRSVPDAIAATVIADIRAGRYGVGDRLPPERDLATSAGVSRGSVREALAELARRGIIERRQGRGSTVISGGNGANLADRIRAGGSDLQNATELRDIVEPRIAALAAFRARDDDLAHLVRLMEARPPNSPSRARSNSTLPSIERSPRPRGTRCSSPSAMSPPSGHVSIARVRTPPCTAAWCRGADTARSSTPSSRAIPPGRPRLWAATCARSATSSRSLIWSCWNREGARPVK